MKSNDINCLSRLATMLVMLVTMLGIGGCNDSNTTPPPEVAVAPISLTFLQKLQQIEGLSVEQKDSPVANYQYYDVRVSQLTDHNVADSAHFNQRVRVLLKDPQAPVVLQTRGYALRSEQNTALGELTQMLQANAVEVEHRYFAESSPSQVDWSTMTIKNAAADHHHIINLLKPLFGGK